MSVRFLLLAIVLVGAAARGPAAAAAAPQIVTLLPFAGGDNVRIEASITNAPADLVLQARITPAGKNNAAAPLWTGTLARSSKGGTTFVRHVRDLKAARRWSPVSPVLYNLSVRAARGNQTLAATVRFGFRSFTSRGGRFYLNDRPIFLRGIAINPPGRSVPPAVGESRRFALDYVRFLKAHNVNTIRLTRDSQTWFDVCDELGMLVYQGVYGFPPGGTRVGPSPDFAKTLAAYKTQFATYVRHPAIVIDILSNEMPVSGKRGAAFHAVLDRAHQSLKKWDPNRLFIGNAGYGEGREGDICDVHRYWGWYYNSFLTYYNLRDTVRLFGDPAKAANQPFTFTECVGSFTGPSGAFNLVERKQIAPQLGWTGHSADQANDALRYQSFMVQQATESFRRLRAQNKRLAGIMPFTILFHHWNGISSFAQMKPKPALLRMAAAYQPVLLSWELWTPQVYGGKTVRAFVHVVNDADDGRDLAGATLAYELRNAAGQIVVPTQAISLPRVAHFGTVRVPVTFALPALLPTGEYVVAGRIVRAGKSVSQNRAALFVAGSSWRKPQLAPINAAVYDPSGKTVAALKRVGVAVRPVSDLSAPPVDAPVLVIGENVDVAAAATPALKSFVQNGGRIVCLAQKEAAALGGWLPVTIKPCTDSANDPAYTPRSRPSRDGMNINPERPGHPVFAGLDRARLRLWSDYTGWDQSRPGFPAVYPVARGFRLGSPDALAQTAVLANYDRGLEGIALAEIFEGKGSVLLSGFDLVPRVGLDPAADRLLRNLLVYAADPNGHAPHPLITRPVRWGDYASERGLITGPMNGLLVNAEWVAPPTNPRAKPLTQAEGAWNTRPGDAFAPRGRRVFGPFGYTTGSSLLQGERTNPTGTGVFWAQIPLGKTTMLTTIKNPAAKNSQLTITVNEKSLGAASVPAGKTITLRSDLGAGDLTNVCVRYQGDKTLVLLETRFE